MSQATCFGTWIKTGVDSKDVSEGGGGGGGSACTCVHARVCMHVYISVHVDGQQGATAVSQNTSCSCSTWLAVSLVRSIPVTACMITTTVVHEAQVGNYSHRSPYNGSMAVLQDSTNTSHHRFHLDQQGGKLCPCRWTCTVQRNTVKTRALIAERTGLKTYLECWKFLEHAVKFSQLQLDAVVIGWKPQKRSENTYSIFFEELRNGCCVDEVPPILRGSDQPCVGGIWTSARQQRGSARIVVEKKKKLGWVRGIVAKANCLCILLAWVHCFSPRGDKT